MNYIFVQYNKVHYLRNRLVYSKYNNYVLSAGGYRNDTLIKKYTI